MRRYICLAGLLTLMSSLSLAKSDTGDALTPPSPVNSTPAPAVSASPGLDVKTRINKGTGVSAVLTRIVSGDGALNSLWSNSRAPQHPAGNATP